MDKVTCIAYLLYKSSKNQDIQEKAIQLLNGDVSIRDLKKNSSLRAHLVIVENRFKKEKIDTQELQLFAEKYMLLEV